MAVSICDIMLVCRPELKMLFLGCNCICLRSCTHSNPLRVALGYNKIIDLSSIVFSYLERLDATLSSAMPQRIHNIDVESRRAGAAKVMSTLQYITHSSAVRSKICHHDADDSAGELSDPFMDEDNNRELSEKRKVYAITIRQ